MAGLLVFLMGLGLFCMPDQALETLGFKPVPAEVAPAELTPIPELSMGPKAIFSELRSEKFVAVTAALIIVMGSILIMTGGAGGGGIGAMLFVCLVFGLILQSQSLLEGPETKPTLAEAKQAETPQAIAQPSVIGQTFKVAAKMVVVLFAIALIVGALLYIFRDDSSFLPPDNMGQAMARAMAAPQPVASNLPPVPTMEELMQPEVFSSNDRHVYLPPEEEDGGET